MHNWKTGIVYTSAGCPIANGGVHELRLGFKSASHLISAMRHPPFGEANMGALAGAVVGAVGGLFAAGIAPAIISGKIAALFATPLLGLICWFVSGPLGWVVGGQVGPRLGEALKSRQAEIIGGILGGLFPVVIIALWGWYMVSGR